MTPLRADPDGPVVVAVDSFKGSIAAAAAADAIKRFLAPSAADTR